MNVREEQRFHWSRWETHIYNVRTAENRLDVSELQTIQIDTGTFHRFSRSLPAKNTTVERVNATVDGIPLAYSPSQQPGTYNTNLDGPFLYVNMYLPRSANAGEQHLLQLDYTISGALRTTQTGKDLLIWPTLPTENRFTIESAFVTLDFPPDRRLYSLETLPPSWRRQQPTPTQIAFYSPKGQPVEHGLEIRASYVRGQVARPRSMARRVILALVLIGLVSLGICGLTTFLPVFSRCMGDPVGDVRDCATAGFAGFVAVMPFGGGNPAAYDPSYNNYVSNPAVDNSSGSSSSSYDSSSSSSSSYDSSSSSSDDSSSSSDSGGDSGGDADGD